MQRAYKKTNLLALLCAVVLLFGCCICIPLGLQRDSIAKGQTANLTLTMDDELCYMPFDYDWYINIKDGNDKVVYSQAFSGVLTSNQTIGLQADAHYRIMVYTPTSVVVNMTLTLGSDYAAVDHNYIGSDFVMPSAGAELDIILNTQNASIFTGSDTI